MVSDPLSPDLIGDIYEAAIDDEGWRGFARRLAGAAGAPTSAVWICDRGQVLDLTVTEDGSKTDLPYRQHFWKLDPWQGKMLQMPSDQVWLGSEVFPEHDLVRTEFYNDFARHFGLFRPMAVTMQLAPGVFATASLERPGSKKLFTERDRPTLARMVPHIKRALQLRLRHREHGPRSQTTAAALNTLALGIVVCNGVSQIIFANEAAEGLARGGAGIILNSRRSGLSAADRTEAVALAAAIRDAAGGGAGGTLRLTGRNGITQLFALVTPLPRSLNNYGPGHAMVSLRPARDRPVFTAAQLNALFALSPAQAEIALGIFNGKSPEQIGADRGVAISTLRTHLAEIFARTGTENQRDLIRLLGMIPTLRNR